MNRNQPARRPIVLALLILALLAAVLPAAAQATTTPTPPPTIVPSAATPSSTPLPAAAQATPTPSPFPPTAPPTLVPTSTPFPNTAPLPVPAASFEFVGIADSFGPWTITLSGLPMDTSRAHVSGRPVSAGDVVKAEGVITDSGQLVAYELKVVDPARSDDQPGELELVGMLTAMTQNRLTIAGLPMDAANAEFGPGVGIGQLIKVHATLNAQGQWIIREIELASADDRAGEFEFFGTITEMGDGYIVVNDQRINIANAEIEGPLAVGAFVEVHLRFVDGQWVASEVDLEDGDDDLNDADDDDSGDDQDDDHDDDADDDHDDDSGDDDHSGDHDDDHDDDDDQDDD